VTAPVHLGHRRYNDAREIAAYAQMRDEAGLDVAEEEILALCFAKRARLLDLGCGAEREAFGAARQGYGVVAVDFVQAMLANGKCAAQNVGLPAQWLQAEVGALPGELRLDLREVGLHLVAKRPLPPPTKGRLGAMAARGADFWYAAAKVS
jgi:SAM-dependent methyltransferase